MSVQQALGAFPPTLHSAISVVAGVLLVAALGEIARRASARSGLAE